MKKNIYLIIVLLTINSNIIFADAFLDSLAIDDSIDNVDVLEKEDLSKLAADIYKEGDNIIVKIDVPGIENSSNIKVSAQDKTLTISGSREEKKEEKDKDFYKKEIKVGEFEYIETLPEEVDATKAKTEYENGTLKIILPKKQKEILK